MPLPLPDTRPRVYSPRKSTGPMITREPLSMQIYELAIKKNRTKEDDVLMNQLVGQRNQRDYSISLKEQRQELDPDEKQVRKFLRGAGLLK
jgi:hypothetical protein